MKAIEGTPLQLGEGIISPLSKSSVSYKFPGGNINTQVFHRICGKLRERQVFNRTKLLMNSGLLPLCINNVHWPRLQHPFEEPPAKRSRSPLFREDAKALKITKGFLTGLCAFAVGLASPRAGPRQSGGGADGVFPKSGRAGTDLMPIFPVQITFLGYGSSEQLLQVSAFQRSSLYHDVINFSHGSPLLIFSHYTDNNTLNLHPSPVQ